MNEQEWGELRSDVKHILIQVEKQNGRVGKLEEQVGALRRWQMLVIGIFTTAGGGIGTLIGKFTS